MILAMLRGSAFDGARLFVAWPVTFLTLLTLTASPVASHAQEFSAQELRGKRVYSDGTSPGGEPVTALVGRDATPVPGVAVPCASCHGADGRGRPEGGVIPSDITWSHLTKPYGHTHRYGRRHPAFTEQSLVRSIVDGLDPAANRIDPAMPRYLMSSQDMTDLLAYMRRLETDLDPGLSDTVIRVGTVLPLRGPRKPLGETMLNALRGIFGEVNAGGGIHGRRIELVVADAVGDLAYRLATLRQLLDEQRVFALVGAFTAGVEEDAAVLVEEEGVPLVGPFTLFPDGADSINQYTFFLFTGPREQGRALVEYATGALTLEDPQVAIVHPSDPVHADIAEAVSGQARSRGWQQIQDVPYLTAELQAASLVTKLHRQGVELLIFLGSRRELGLVLGEAAAIGWSPYLLVPGTLASSDMFLLPQDFEGRVLLAYPTLPADQTDQGLVRLQELPGRGGNRPAQISAFVAGQVFVEGLKRVGRDLSRKKLVLALESLRDYRSGLTPAITYGPNRRVGASGAYIVALDLRHRRFRPVSGWIALD